MNRCIFLLIVFSAYSLSIAAQQWHPLFDGSNLDQWEKRGGTASYDIVDNTIVGTAAMDHYNTFLCTKEKFSDFILELEIFLPNHLNSGIQFRSNVNERGFVAGYQCEIDPSQRKFSGGIYDESRRGWMYPLSRNPKAQNAFELGTWNQIRIECLENDLRTFINGQQCSWLIDNETANGFIGLQVHGIGSKESVGYQVKWRNIRIATEEVEKYRWPTDPDIPQLNYLKNELTAWEKERGWKLLWDGKTTNGWRDATHHAFPEKAWKIENGELIVLGVDESQKKGSGDIITTSTYNNFELELEFKVTAGANSGIKYFVNPNLNEGKGSTIGCEFQILDDQLHPDAKQGKKGNRTVASLYDLIAADNLNTPGRGKQFKGIGAWNKARIVSQNGKVEHWLNNELALEYDRFSQIFQALVNYSKFENDTNFGQWPEGVILLQDHGDVVHFRSIKIRRLGTFNK